jgi:hypothetical protein
MQATYTRALGFPCVVGGWSEASCIWGFSRRVLRGRGLAETVFDSVRDGSARVGASVAEGGLLKLGVGMDMSSGV